MIGLDARLLAVVSEIAPCDTVADIGSDHGKVAVYCMQHKLCNKVIASDISKSSADKSRELSDKLGIRVDVRVGDGVSILALDECDTVVIAGMGAQEIIHIISNAKYPFAKYIFVPHSKSELLRIFMRDNGLKAVKDYKVLCNRHYYDIIVAECGEYSPNYREILYGKCENTVVFDEFMSCEINRIESVLKRANGEKKVDYVKRYKVLTGNDYES